MTITTELYNNSIKRLPRQGQHVIAYHDNNDIVVYQAYNHAIADFAIENQQLGGTHYSYNRMSWIKPNFLWMMYRCGWASKLDQERVLAIWISREHFEEILEQAVFSSFSETHYASREEWRKELEKKEVRLQWDPDHDPAGGKLVRRAIQLGMKGEVLRRFGQQQIKKIEDLTGFVKQQKVYAESGAWDQLQVPFETVYKVNDSSLKKAIGIDCSENN
jgi:putative NIF3 family GTP cyclohydrolase 1 type 2